MIIRACHEVRGSDEIGCSPLTDPISPASSPVDSFLAIYDYVSMKGQTCISEKPMQFDVTIPQSYVTTGSIGNGASYVSAKKAYNVLMGMFMILCLK
ncbi:hypothetical protein DPMN_180283 [Dreissena polymorpha]|uniref:Uncharacterized protein n=1 Tax=Dreissena polymorpha TaxID=45954 RepID=A0A9D4EHU8_DREPO|nr:hypothetical protein DPMN_180283 [Dreissena polymorpha]